jgi:glycine hydroxymethyltransferase
MDTVKQKLQALITAEEQRQNEQLNMIPSENHVSRDVMNAVGSVLINKYSEGVVGKRYYQGNKHIDEIEEIVKQLALQLFKLNSDEWGVIVQAATGSVANLAVLTGLLEVNDKILSMHLYDGGHLSHGWKLPDGKKTTISSKIFDSYFYNVDPNNELFHYEEILQKAKGIMPKMIISGGTAYPREIDHAEMRNIADSVQAFYMADIAHEAGLVATGVNRSPFEYAHVVTMTTRKTLRGPIGAIIFARKELVAQIESALFPGIQGGPLNHSIAGIGIALAEAMQPDFALYSDQTVKNAKVLGRELLERGYHVLTKGTDKHLLVIDLRNKNLTGSKAATALEAANIIVNKNTVPNDTGKPWNPSGIRLGTPALTTRGMKEKEMLQIAEFIDIVLTNTDNEKLVVEVAEAARNLALSYPAYS